MEEYRLGFVGFGHMARVLFEALDRAQLIPRSQIQFTRRDPLLGEKDEERYQIAFLPLAELVRESDVLLLGVRPSQVEAALSQLASVGAQEKGLLSILAGVEISFLQRYLDPSVSVIRVMPNLAAKVGEGMAVLSLGPHCSVELRSFAHLLFASMGEVVEVAESAMDLACALSGSGPGFVFRLIEAAARLGEKEGLSYELSLRMVAQAFAGASRLILEGHAPSALIQEIATPGGTTEAGFRVMKESGLEQYFQATLLATAERSRKLSEEYR